MLLAYVTHVRPDNGDPLPILNPTKFVARISQSNEGSIALFKKLGFFVTKTVEVFGEVEMRYMRSGFWEAGEERDYTD